MRVHLAFIAFDTEDAVTFIATDPDQLRLSVIDWYNDQLPGLAPDAARLCPVDGWGRVKMLVRAWVNEHFTVLMDQWVVTQ